MNNKSLIFRLANDEGKLRSVCLILNKEIRVDSKTMVNMMDMVSYGIDNSVSTRAINAYINEPHINARVKAERQLRDNDRIA